MSTDTNALRQIIEDGENNAVKVHIPEEELSKLRYALTEALILRECPRNVAIKIARGIEVNIVCLKEHQGRVQEDEFVHDLANDAAGMIINRVASFYEVDGITDDEALGDKVVDTVSIVLQELTEEEISKLKHAGVIEGSEE